MRNDVLEEPQQTGPLLSVRDLFVNFGHGKSGIAAVSGVSFDVPRSGTVGIVGESGSGKSVTSLALTRLFPKSAKATITGRITFRGRDLITMPGSELRALRGVGISYIFQDPLSALNPVRRCGEQVAEAILIHQKVSGGQADARVAELFDRLGLPRARETMHKYPHELSGGMRQRVMIAMALACKPALLIADEPTTALDVVVQRQIVDLLKKTIKDLGTSLLFISHDLALVSSITEKIVVMRNGEIVESGATENVWRTPKHPYTRQLWDATPTLRAPSRPPLEVRNPERAATSTELLRIEGVTHSFFWGKGGKVGPVALDDVSLTAREGETVCIVGESGSGKSTLGRCVVGLLKPDKGRVSFGGHALIGRDTQGWRPLRRDIQMVFQDPYASLNPRMKIADLVAEGLIINRMTSTSQEARRRAIELLEMVGLNASHGGRYPHQFSGGQRQRIAIARALAVRPKLLVCDEPVTSLDVSTRAQIVQLLIDIQNQEGVTYLFITHDIALARQIGDRVAVMSQGRVVETGLAVDVIDHPRDAYTRELRNAVPDLPDIDRAVPEEAEARRVTKSL